MGHEQLLIPIRLGQELTAPFGLHNLGEGISRNLQLLKQNFLEILIHKHSYIIKSTRHISLFNIERPENSIILNMRILLAEDNELNQKVTLAMLKRLGYKADTALNGIEVLLALEHRRYDLILMNIGLPLLDGIEATEEIRRRWLNGPRIVALTARVLPEMKRKCFEAGMDDYIAKPVQMRELAETLKRCALKIQ